MGLHEKECSSELNFLKRIPNTLFVPFYRSIANSHRDRAKVGEQRENNTSARPQPIPGRRPEKNSRFQRFRSEWSHCAHPAAAVGCYRTVNFSRAAGGSIIGQSFGSAMSQDRQIEVTTWPKDMS